MKNKFQILLLVLSLFTLSSGLHAQTLPKENPPFGEGLYLLQEYQALAGQTVQQQLVTFRQWLRERFGYNIQCDYSLLGGLSPVQCLIGMRTFADTVYQDLIPEFPIKGEVFITVLITSPGDSHALQWKGQSPQIKLAYNLHSEDMGTFLRTQISNQDFVRGLRLLSDITGLKSSFEKATQIEIGFDPSLDLDQRFRGLYVLNELLQANPDLLKNHKHVEVLEIGTKFKYLFEQNLKYVQEIDASSSFQEINQFLTSTPLPWIAAWLSHQNKLRHETAGLSGYISQRYGIKMVFCSHLSDLTIQKCDQALQRLAKAELKIGLFQIPADALVVTAPDEISESYDFYLDPETGRQMLTLSSNFSLSSLEDLVSKEGWRLFLHHKGIL